MLALAGWLAERPGFSPRPDLSTGLAALIIKVYLTVVHRMKVEGLEHLGAAVRMKREGGGRGGGRGLIVTANHAAGIDPLLVQIAVGESGGDGNVYIRWLAAADTVASTVRPFVEFAEVIFLTSAGDGGNELAGVREVVRHVQHGGTVGLFPEGRIARRRGVITPFQPGVGLMVARSKGIVLPVVLRGVPVFDNTYRSFFTFSRSSVVFMPPIDYAASGLKPSAIVSDLQSRYEGWVGPVVAAQGRTRK